MAGAVGSHEAVGHWFAAVDSGRCPEDPDWRTNVAALLQEPHGDRRQEIVFIGIGMDQGALRHDHDASLLTDTDMQAELGAWVRLPNPFPAWR